MFGANRKKFLEGGVESEYGDDSSLYYSQQSMFPPHRSDKEVSPFFSFAAVTIAGIYHRDNVVVVIESCLILWGNTSSV